MNILGRNSREVRDRVGDPGQIFRIDKFVSDDGPARGSRVIRLASGGALEVELHPDRALDIGRVTYRGVPIAWLSPTGFGAPGLAEHLGDGWVRTWGGGLLSTVGLDSFGPSGTDGTEEFGTHGRIGAQPATVTRCEITDSQLVVEAEVRQATAFADSLRLTRRVTVPIGESRIIVDDTVVNDGPDPVEWMILYHVNLGWPLLDSHTDIRIPSTDGSERLEFGEPIAEFQQSVVQFVLPAGEDTVTVHNPKLDVALSLKYSVETLPWLNTWRVPQRQRYVMALEPSNTPSVAGRLAARASGDIATLESGASSSLRLEFLLDGC